MEYRFHLGKPSQDYLGGMAPEETQRWLNLVELVCCALTSKRASSAFKAPNRSRMPSWPLGTLTVPGHFTT